MEQTPYNTKRCYIYLFNFIAYLGHQNRGSLQLRSNR